MFAIAVALCFVASATLFVGFAIFFVGNNIADAIEKGK